MKIPMKATKAMTYATRRLKADDEFQATRRDARVLNAIGRATYATRDVVAAPSKRDPLDHDGDGRKGGSKKPEQTGELPGLRAEYEKAVGKRPFMGWDADTLREKIAEAKD